MVRNLEIDLDRSSIYLQVAFQQQKEEISELRDKLTGSKRTYLWAFQNRKIS